MQLTDLPSCRETDLMSQMPSNVLLDDHEIRDTKTAEKYLTAGDTGRRGAGDRLGAIEAYEAAYTADP